MKITALKIALIAGVSFGLQFFLPWWIIVIVAFAIELLFGGKTSLSFFSGFYGIFIYWLVYAGIIDFQNGFLLSKKNCAAFSFAANAVDCCVGYRFNRWNCCGIGLAYRKSVQENV